MTPRIIPPILEITRDPYNHHQVLSCHLDIVFPTGTPRTRTLHAGLTLEIPIKHCLIISPYDAEPFLRPEPQWMIIPQQLFHTDPQELSLQIVALSDGPVHIPPNTPLARLTLVPITPAIFVAPRDRCQPFPDDHEPPCHTGTLRQGHPLPLRVTSL